jgi:hypothetical protein
LTKSSSGRKPAEGKRPFIVGVILPGLEHLGFRPWGSYATQDVASRTARRLRKRGLYREVRVFNAHRDDKVESEAAKWAEHSAMVH